MTPEEATRLRTPFPKSVIGQLPKGGVMLDYVGHAATTDRLLQVDPEWSWEPFSLDERGLPALDPEGNLWIRLTVCGITRPGVGDGKNAKERIGDALRNAAMRFGVALDLWAKEDLQARNGDGTRADSDESAEAAAPQSPSPAAASAALSPAAQKPTTRQLKNLNRLVGTLRDQGAISTENLWAALANARKLDVTEMIDLFPAAYSPDGQLHWSPLRDSLDRGEASNLIDRLTRLEENFGGGEA